MLSRAAAAAVVTVGAVVIAFAVVAEVAVVIVIVVDVVVTVDADVACFATKGKRDVVDVFGDGTVVVLDCLIPQLLQLLLSVVINHSG